MNASMTKNRHTKGIDSDTLYPEVFSTLLTLERELALCLRCGVGCLCTHLTLC